MRIILTLITLLILVLGGCSDDDNTNDAAVDASVGDIAVTETVPDVGTAEDSGAGEQTPDAAVEAGNPDQGEDQ